MTTDTQENVSTNVPNLDAIDPDELQAFWYLKAHEIFPTRPTGYINVADDLQAYASNKRMAHVCRETGSIQQAQRYEAICDGIYARLPDYARW